MALLGELRDLVGNDHLLTDPGATAPYLTDWRRRYVGQAQAVVLPASTAIVAQVVQRCAQAGVALVAQGGNTGLVGGATPDRSGTSIVLSLRRLNRIRAIDTANDTLTAEAGCLLQTVQEAALEHQRLFPLSLAAEGSCTIGGNLSTNAGGTQVLRYGNMRALTLGLEVVLPDGRIWDGLRGLRKDNTGYDLKQLFIGAEGTLGLICAATLRLFPVPRARVTALAALATLDDAVALLGRMSEAAGPALTAFELMSASCLRLVASQFPEMRQPLATVAPWSVLIELSDHDGEAHGAGVLEGALAEALQRGRIVDAAVAHSGAAASAMWRLRESIPMAQARAGGNLKHDIAMPISEVSRFVADTDARLRREFEWLEPYTFGHLGDGNLHYNFGRSDGGGLEHLAAFEARINTIVHDAVAAGGGSISAEHGIGQMKRDTLLRYKSPIEIDLMRALKHAFDPHGLMNPGKVL